MTKMEEAAQEVEKALTTTCARRASMGWCLAPEDPPHPCPGLDERASSLRCRCCVDCTRICTFAL